MEQWNSDGRTEWWNGGTVMVEQWSSDGGTVKQCWWNRETLIVQQWNSDGETVWWKSDNDSKTVLVEQ